MSAAPDTGAVRRDSARRRDTERGGGAGAGPTIVLLASASAREVRFAAQPRIVVRLCGGVADSIRVIERRNLPDPVQPGTTYRDVYIAVEIIGRLNAECLSARITGAPRPSGSADPCASLGVRDSAGATPTRRPP